MVDLQAVSAFNATLLRFQEPDWTPLLRLAEDDDLVVGQFVWMHCLRLEDNRVVHAYKHTETRRYLYLGEDLTPFEYHGESERPYHAVTLGIALREVFCLCRELGYPEEAELQAAEALIERHSRYPRVPRERPGRHVGLRTLEDG